MSEEHRPANINSARSCLNKLLMLENARKRLERELRIFTEKANEEVEGFLKLHQSPADCTKILNTIESRCNIIKKLEDIFQQLKAVADPECGSFIAEKPKGALLCVPMLKWSRDVTITSVLKFGPMLRNTLMASSAANVVQTLGTALIVQQIPTQPASQTTHCHAQVEMCKNLGPAPRGEVTDKDNDNSNAAVALKRDPCFGVSLETAQLQPVGNVHPKLIPHVNGRLLDGELGGDVGVPHQKQTTSQLMQFLQAQYKADPSGSTFCSGMGKATAGISSPGPPDALAGEFELLEVNDSLRQEWTKGLEYQRCPAVATYTPVFKVKQNGPAGSFTYSCMVATESELWDLGEVLSGEVRGLSESASASEVGSCVSPEGSDDLCSKNPDFPLRDCNPRVRGPLPAGDVDVDADSGTFDGQASVLQNPNEGIRIPEFRIRKFDEIEVTVTHVVNPGNFCIQQTSPELKQLLLSMKTLGSSDPPAGMKCVPDIGAFVLGWFSEQRLWCRAQVLKICGIRREATPNLGGVKTIEVEVRRIDYGNVARLLLRDVLEIDSSIALLPKQALQVSLANVTPANGQDWSPEAVGWFEDNVKNRTLYARLYPQGEKVTAELFTEKGKLGAMRRSASLSLRLAQNGHATHVKMRSVNWKSSEQQTRKLSSTWQKYLMCYSQKKKSA